MIVHSPLLIHKRITAFLAAPTHINSRSALLLLVFPNRSIIHMKGCEHTHVTDHFSLV